MKSNYDLSLTHVRGLTMCHCKLSVRMPFCLHCCKWCKWSGKIPVLKNVFYAHFSLLLCRASRLRHKISKPKQSAGPDNNSRKEVRASPDTKIINPVRACSAPFLPWEMSCCRLKEERTPRELYQPVFNCSINTIQTLWRASTVPRLSSRT